MRLLSEDYADELRESAHASLRHVNDDEEEKVYHYREFLVRHFGRPMERALIKAEQRYEKLRPSRIRAKALHRAYHAKR